MVMLGGTEEAPVVNRVVCHPRRPPFQRARAVKAKSTLCNYVTHHLTSYLDSVSSVRRNRALRAGLPKRKTGGNEGKESH